VAGLGSGEGGEPSWNAVGVGGAIEGGRLDRVDPPAVGEGGDDLVAGEPTRSAWHVAEAQHEIAPARRQDGSQAVEVGAAVGVIVEDVDAEPAVEHGVEGFAEGGQASDVQVDEPDGESAVAGFVLGGVKSHAGQIDTGGVEAEGGAHKRVFAGSAADVEHPAVDGARFGEGQECRLGRPMSHRGLLA
jgi:hypothetical protein